MNEAQSQLNSRHRLPSAGQPCLDWLGGSGLIAGLTMPISDGDNRLIEGQGRARRPLHWPG